MEVQKFQIILVFLNNVVLEPEAIEVEVEDEDKALRLVYYLCHVPMST